MTSPGVSCVTVNPGNVMAVYTVEPADVGWNVVNVTRSSPGYEFPATQAVNHCEIGADVEYCAANVYTVQEIMKDSVNTKTDGVRRSSSCVTCP